MTAPARFRLTRDVLEAWSDRFGRWQQIAEFQGWVTKTSRRIGTRCPNDRGSEMTFRPMKPETIVRRAVEHARERAERTARLERDLRENAERDGPDSIWAEMLAERQASK